MELSDQHIAEFQTLYKNHFGKEISREEAYEKGIKLLRLIKLVYKPLTEEELSKLQKRRKETNYYD